MKYNILFNKKNLLIFFLFSFSLFINQYFGNKGVFPVDSFSHFDTGFRILLGEYPFKNYWVNIPLKIIGLFQDLSLTTFRQFFFTYLE